MSQQYVVYLENRIRFKTETPVSVDEVISSLKGMERLVQTRFPRAIKQLTGATVKEVKLEVSGVEEGSLIEDTLITVIFGNKKNYDKFVNGVRSKYVSKNNKGETVVKGWVAGSLLVAVVVLGIAYYQKSASPTPPPVGGLVTVNGDNNVIVTVGAESYNKSPQDFVEALEKSMTNQQKIAAAKAGVDMLAPARNQGAAVEIMPTDEKPVELMSSATARNIPAAVERRDNSEDKSYGRVKLNFRAMDSDSDSKGWAGTIPQIVDARTRVIFADPRDVAKVTHKPSADVDATVTYSDALHTKAILIIVEKVY
ncbi:TPA: hypothetical protein QDZ42_001365 [Stenotrophomonas maltophilia]|nr:hypothetical protein [Stenotrophomonas maltophilia]HDS1042726.1 hypothetical protein [Stenotrophomonas maltophilia]